MKNKRTIGRKDIVDFPDLALENIAVKVDTGAYTSSIHCCNIAEKVIDGEVYVAFELLASASENDTNKRFEMKIHKEKMVKNSFGISEKRYIIKTNIKLFGELYPIQLSLSDRSAMKFPVLIGRRLLNKKFIVDTSKRNLSYKKKIKTNK